MGPMNHPRPNFPGQRDISTLTWGPDVRAAQPSSVHTRRCAIAVAATIYPLAMREEMLPRFSKDDMPEPAR